MEVVTQSEEALEVRRVDGFLEEEAEELVELRVQFEVEEPAVLIGGLADQVPQLAQPCEQALNQREDWIIWIQLLLQEEHPQSVGQARAEETAANRRIVARLNTLALAGEHSEEGNEKLEASHVLRNPSANGGGLRVERIGEGLEAVERSVVERNTASSDELLANAGGGVPGRPEPLTIGHPARRLSDIEEEDAR